MLTVQTYGEESSHPPILIAHGLFGSARNWGVIAKRLSEVRRVLVVDMRNHGDSPWMEAHSYPDLANDLAEVIAAHGGTADVMGHSMGGKAAMVLALTHPEAVRRLVVADIAPVAYGHTQQHLIDAMRKVDLSVIESRRDADTQLARHVTTDGVRAFLLQSLDVKARKWRLNLDVLEKDMELILSFPQVQGTFDGPTLFLTGAESDYVRHEDRPAIKALFPNAKFAKIPGAGHWLHADKPREFEASLRAFFTAT
ncbi:alpha/beta fold hydrolase [Roseibacterium beibuensis]|uniref:Alpha/beta fold hydrolase n=1 Tax=[Roseibacterium] beibuensis TaxID=1193142 RepID=A0ABP9LB20_9RHOB|nr:alpha/beta fold hydrolase [Roseibacterium beibuensis]MCS6624170.1 alpha/beta fold hydrolase [Roseibacterium beibuensis]